MVNDKPVDGSEQVRRRTFGKLKCSSSGQSAHGGDYCRGGGDEEEDWRRKWARVESRRVGLSCICADVAYAWAAVTNAPNPGWTQAPRRLG